MNKFFERAAKAVTEGIYPPPRGRKALCGKGFECLTNKKHGFTLAEILISLLILGVIASLTIPSLIQNTHKKEEQVKAKKALSMLNQAISMNYTLTGKDLTDYVSTDGPTEVTPLFNDLKNRLSITEYYDNGTMVCFKTQDGLIYILENGNFDPSLGSPSMNNSTFVVTFYTGTDNMDSAFLSKYMQGGKEIIEKLYEFKCLDKSCSPSSSYATAQRLYSNDLTKWKYVDGTGFIEE